VTVSNHQRLRRATPVLALAVVAFAAGAALGAGHGASPAYTLADQFVRAWTRGDYATMYSDIDTTAQARTPVSEFASDYQQALRTATATATRIVGHARSLADGEVEVPVRVKTRLWGTLALDFTLKVGEAGSSGQRVDWSRSLTFPGLRTGELLSRRTYLPSRAELLARDGSVLAEQLTEPSTGSQPTEQMRNSPLGAAAEAILGNVGPIPSSRRVALEAQGVPAQAIVGVSGLELAFDEHLRGTPGGELLAGARLLAYAAPRPAPALRTTVSPALQNAVATGLGDQLGGVIAMQPTGQILAVAGLGLDGLQPPGSTFKMITLTGVLQANVATPRTVFPYATYATLDGVKLHNANGEECGGSLALAFAVSCNSVFTPLGVKLGAPRLVGTAERYGFNHDPDVPGAAESTLPAAGDIQGELDVGSTAIGQGEVLATPLEMATVAATIADEGRRPQPTFTAAHTTADAGVQVTSASVARTVRRLMIGVVREGTGTSAAIPGVTVAGKTGTAELKAACTSSATETSASESSSEPPKETCQGNETEASNTDAWFAAFAPAVHPKIVICVLLVKDGAGGDTAAPVARGIIETALQDGD
jgi:penicillin-binding protein A